MDKFDFISMFYLSPLYLIVPLSAISYILIQHKIKKEKIQKISKVAQEKYLNQFSMHNIDIVDNRSIYDYIIPVILSTIVISGGLYTTFLVGESGNTPFMLGNGFASSHPENISYQTAISLSAIAWSFLGAYIFGLQSIFRRYVYFDLYPRVYYDIVIRIVYAVSLALLIRFIFDKFSVSALAPAVFFMVGAFPERGFIYIDDKISKIPGFGQKNDNSAKNLPLSMIEGLSLLHCSRLKELGIDNVQNLAVYDYVELLIITPFNPETIAKWIGSAKLTLIFGNKVTNLNDIGIYDVFSFKMSYDDEKIDNDELSKLTSIDKLQLEIAYKQIENDKFIPLVDSILTVRESNDK
ncbi:hypothetical protein QUF50_00020 [Thiotrichales bacterium HSG1]|nr:hypothetical protein [Thiotrichales bacterium HSG1]